MRRMTRRSFVRLVGAGATALGAGSIARSDETPTAASEKATIEIKPSSTSKAAVIDVGDQKQLFIDERFVEQKSGVKLTVNPPAKSEFVLMPETPWEAMVLGFYGSVIEDEGIYKLWYDAYVGIPKYPTAPRSVCYATSKDGLHWERPNVNLYNFFGHRENNIVMPGVVYAPVMKDPKGPDEHRYKALCAGYGDNEMWEESKKLPLWDGTGGGIFLLTSPDGLRWKAHLPAASPFPHDSQPNLLYDEKTGKYNVYLRTHRRIARTLDRVEIDDPMKTPYPARMIPPDRKANKYGLYPGPVSFPMYEHAYACDDDDPPLTDVQVMPITRYPWAQDAYIALADIFKFHGEPSVNDGIQEVQLAVSRDGKSWHRPQRKPYIPLGLDGSWDGGNIWPCLGILRRGDEIWQYYCGTSFTHAGYPVADKAGGLRLVRQRLDGFVSLDGDYAGGTFTTPSIRFAGNQLQLNADCTAVGHIKVAIADEQGHPIPGYTMQDSTPLQGNHIAARMSWKEIHDLSTLAGRTIRLQFEMRASKLFAFQFSSRPS